MLRRVLPRGRSLPDEVWRRRHRAILVLLWLHVPAIFLFGVFRGEGLGHDLNEAALVAPLALLASLPNRSRTFRSGFAAVGLLSSSAILVHLSGGTIEMHFHFFVIVGVLTMYEDWATFLIAIAYVLLHHGLMGALDARSVYNHPAAWANPWKWAAIHGFFVAAASVAYLVAWRMSEDVRARLAESSRVLAESEERFRRAFDDAAAGMTLSDLNGRFLRVNRSFCEFTGYPEEQLLTMSALEVSHPDDVEQQQEVFRRVQQGEARTFQTEKRYIRADGNIVWGLLTLSTVTDQDGRPVHFVGQIQDISARKQAQDELAHRALHDPLTGLPNRALLRDRLSQALARTLRNDRFIGVLFVDLDRFKAVNDTLGHEAGDQVLMSVAERLRNVLRPSDTVARFGGDEFVVLCETLADEEEALTIADRIRAAISEPTLLHDTEIVLGASIGIALARGDQDPDALLRDSDAAMYRAKQRGRGRNEVFDEHMRSTVLASLDTESSLRRAINRDELRLFYQPILSVELRQVVGAEALLRWERPGHGLVLPSDFIPVAEESGLIVPIGEWVIQEASREAERLQGFRPGQPVPVSVNLSGRQLAQTDLASLVSRALVDAEADPSGLWLEITESVFMGEPELIVKALRNLKAVGVRLAIDDFGTGYSSLVYLRRFPVDILKIDRSFVDGLGRDPGDTAIVTAVIGMAHALGLRAVAEGVETSKQFEALKRLECDLAQGYLLGMPMEAEDLERLVVRPVLVR